MIINFSNIGGGSGSGGSVVEVTQVLSAGTKIATISVDETPTDLYAPSAATVDLSDYYTSAETQDYVTGQGYQTSGNVETLIAGATSAFTTSGQVEAMQNYRIVSDLSEIDNPVEGDMAWVSGETELEGHRFNLPQDDEDMAEVYWQIIDDDELEEPVYQLLSMNSGTGIGFYLSGAGFTEAVPFYVDNYYDPDNTGYTGTKYWLIGQNNGVKLWIAYVWVQGGGSAPAGKRIVIAIEPNKGYQFQNFTEEGGRYLQPFIPTPNPNVYDGENWVYNPQGFVTSADVGNQIMASSGQVASQIASATSAFTTSADFKTINYESIIGSGNIDIQGGGGDSNYLIVNNDEEAGYESGENEYDTDSEIGVLAYKRGDELYDNGVSSNFFYDPSDTAITDGDVIFTLMTYDADSNDYVGVGSLYFIVDNGNISFGFSAETTAYTWMTSGTWEPNDHNGFGDLWYFGEKPYTSPEAGFIGGKSLLIQYKENVDWIDPNTDEPSTGNMIAIAITRDMLDIDFPEGADFDASLGYGYYEAQGVVLSLKPTMWLSMPKEEFEYGYDYGSEHKLVPFNPVNSTDIRNIVKLTQNDYDELVNNDQVDPMTLYLIEEE